MGSTASERQLGQEGCVLPEEWKPAAGECIISSFSGPSHPLLCSCPVTGPGQVRRDSSACPLFAVTAGCHQSLKVQPCLLCLTHEEKGNLCLSTLRRVKFLLNLENYHLCPVQFRILFCPNLYSFKLISRHT